MSGMAAAFPQRGRPPAPGSPSRPDIRGDVRKAGLAFIERAERAEREAEVVTAILYRVLGLGESWKKAAAWSKDRGGVWTRTYREVRHIVERARILGDDGSPLGRKRRADGRKGLET